MSIRPGKATWVTKDYDFPVEVVRYLGTTDGVRYYLIRSDDGETGVPEYELRQKKQSFQDMLYEWRKKISEVFP